MNRWLTIFCTVFLLIAGCTERTTCPCREPGLATAPYIDDVIVYAESDSVPPASWTGDEIVFDLSEIPFFTDGGYNAIRVAYRTPTYCDHDMFVLNQTTGAWHQFASRPPPGFDCLMVPARHFHVFLPSKMSISDLIGSEQILKLRVGPSRCPAVCCPAAYAVRVNPRYYPIDPEGWCYDTDWHDGSIWVSYRDPSVGTERIASITRISVQGEKLDSIPIPWELVYGLTFDGRSFWTSSNRMNVYRLNLNGEPACSLQLDLRDADDMSVTWGDDALWLSVLWRESVTVYRIDALPTCIGQTTPTVSTLGRFPSECGNNGIAWTGRHLLVAGDRLYRITRHGGVIDTYRLPVRDVVGLAWNGEGVWLVHRGPKTGMDREQVISRFLLR